MTERDTLIQLEEWAAPLLAKLSSAERRSLSTSIARSVRKSQRQRIAAQKNLDGSRYQQRRSSSRQGRIKRKAMFIKMRQAKHLKAFGDSSSVSVGFIGRVARIARVHQYGLKDQVSPGGPSVNYQRRELLGFSETDIEMIRSLLLDHFSSATPL